MLWGQAIDQAHRLVPGADYEDCPCSCHDTPAIAARGRLRSSAATWSATRSAKGAESLIGNRLRRLVVLGLRQQVKRDVARVVGGVGQYHHLRGAGDEVEADAAKNLALCVCPTYAFPGPTMRSTGKIASVPYASAAMAWAPPTRKISVTPASRAAASTSGFSTPSGAGTHMAILCTPAIRAGRAFISTEDG